MREHAVNPVLYVEYENISGADKTILEVVGHDGQSDLAGPNAEARREHQHEAELKLILSSNLKAGTSPRTSSPRRTWGTRRGSSAMPWAPAVRCGPPSHGRECTFCAEKFAAGVEAYGGLGDTWSLTLGDTSHYIAPLLGLAASPRHAAELLSWFRTHFYEPGPRLPRRPGLGVHQIGTWFRSSKGGAR